jgi:hypothetical protein
MDPHCASAVDSLNERELFERAASIAEKRM